jgi:XTP/dITP diphosphohydrolase
MKIVLATANRDKAREIEAVLGGMGVELVPLDAFPGVRPAEEVGLTFEENARLKAVSVRDQTGLPALADDSGLEVDALGGLPGVRSSRFAGENAGYAANNRRLLAVLRGLPPEDRAGRFVCVAVVAHTDGEVFCARGTLEGRILAEARGSGGFGYDPLFLVPAYGRTLAEVGPEVKNRISHRARAMEGIRRHLASRMGPTLPEPFD